ARRRRDSGPRRTPQGRRAHLRERLRPGVPGRSGGAARLGPKRTLTRPGERPRARPPDRPGHRRGARGLGRRAEPPRGRRRRFDAPARLTVVSEQASPTARSTARIALGALAFGLFVGPGPVVGLLPWLITRWRIHRAFFGWTP